MSIFLSTNEPEIIFVTFRKEGKEEQLMAAQAHLKLGEVGAETGELHKARLYT